MPKYPGKLIVIEGPDASGKTSTLTDYQSSLNHQLSNHLLPKKLRHKTVFTLEPGGTKLANQIRNLILDPDQTETIDRITELTLFLAARRTHLLNYIVPHLKNGDIVICDRFTFSTIVYQGGLNLRKPWQYKTNQENLNQIIRLNNLITTIDDLQIKPDLMIYFNASSNTLINRMENRNQNQHGNLDRHDLELSKNYHRIDYLNRNYLGILEYIESNPILKDQITHQIIRLDANQERNQRLTTFQSIIKNYL